MCCTYSQRPTPPACGQTYHSEKSCSRYGYLSLSLASNAYGDAELGGKKENSEILVHAGQPAHIDLTEIDCVGLAVGVSKAREGRVVVRDEPAAAA